MNRAKNAVRSAEYIDRMLNRVPGEGGVASSVEAQAAAMGVHLVRPVQDRRSKNKFLGSEKPQSRINPNGFDPVKRATQQAKDAVKENLARTLTDHG